MILGEPYTTRGETDNLDFCAADMNTRKKAHSFSPAACVGENTSQAASVEPSVFAGQ